MEKSENYTGEEMSEIEKARTISDAELLKTGASYSNEGEEKILIASEKNIEQANSEMKDELLFKRLPGALNERFGNWARLTGVLEDMAQTATDKKLVEPEKVEKIVEAVQVIKSLEVTLGHVESLRGFISYALDNKDEDISVNWIPTSGAATTIKRDVKLLVEGKLNEYTKSDGWSFRQVKDILPIADDFTELVKRQILYTKGLAESLDGDFFENLSKELESNESYGGWYKAEKTEYQKQALLLLDDLRKHLRGLIVDIGAKTSSILGKDLETLGGIYRSI